MLLMDRVISTMFLKEEQKEHLKYLKRFRNKILTLDTVVLGYLIECVAKLPTTLDADAAPPMQEGV